MITPSGWQCALCGHREDPAETLANSEWPHRERAEVLGTDGQIIPVCDRCQIIATITVPYPTTVLHPADA